MDVHEVMVTDHGGIVIPTQALDALGVQPGTRLQLRISNGALAICKAVRLDWDKWIGSAADDGLSTHEAVRQLRGGDERTPVTKNRA